MLEYDPIVVDFLHLICSRAIVSEQIKYIPAKEQPTREMLEGYIQCTDSEEDLAWSDMFVPLIAWLHDRENRKKKREKELPDHPQGGGMGQYNYSR